MLLSVTFGCIMFLRDHAVMSVSVDFVGKTSSLLVRTHCSSVLMYSRRCVAEVSGVGCCEKIVMSSALDSMCVPG